MCRYCNTITMHHASAGQASICVESLYGFLNGWPNLKPYWLRKWEVPVSKPEKVAETGRNSLIRRTYTYLDKTSLTKLYASLVRCKLEYGYSAWAPMYSGKDCELLERV